MKIMRPDETLSTDNLLSSQGSFVSFVPWLDHKTNKIALDIMLLQQYPVWRLS